MPTLADIAVAIGGRVVGGDPWVVATDITHDSRAVRPGSIFAVMPGQKTDGRRFIDDAQKAGAVALLVDSEVASHLPRLWVSDTRQQLGLAAAMCYGHPTSALAVAGITGTNGKTTTTYLVESALNHAGHAPGVMGTIEYRLAKQIWPAAHTTPESPVIQAIARKMVDAGATHLVMEVSSHGLALNRLDGCDFDVVAFSNLTQDHLDFHGDMAAYARAKLKLFTSAIDGKPQARVVVNCDDAYATTIRAAAKHQVIGVSCHETSRADIRPQDPPRFHIGGVEVKLATPWGPCTLVSPMVGRHNLSNLLLALGIVLSFDVPLEYALRGLSGCDAVPGRLERVPFDGPFAVVVDYAHTPDALARVLQALRSLTAGRLICVFGCGGDRDPTKRPLMGGAVAQWADLCVVTSDNPRTENPEEIIEMILPGITAARQGNVVGNGPKSAKGATVVEPNRRDAIAAAIGAAGPGDTVLIAGKGHEDYQILGETKIHFDDRQEAVRVLATKGVSRHD